MYSSTLQNEVRMLLREMVAGLSSLVDHIPRDEEAVMGLEGSREEILKATGQVWQVCDRINKVAGSGIVGLAVEKVDAFHALVKDAVEEIEGWDPDEEEESLFGSDSSDLNQMGAANANGATNGEKHGAEDEPEPPALDGLQIKDMHVLKDRAVKVLKLIRMLYPALRKRRVSTFVHFDRSSDVESLPSQAKVETLDHILGCLKQFSEAIDEVAGSLYGGEAGEVDDKLETLKNTAEQCVGKVRLDWDGREDEFSIWSGKWIERVKETGQRA